MNSNIIYVSENKIFITYKSGKTQELTAQRAVKYKQAIKSINKRKEWKNTGSGAQFMGAYRDKEEFEESSYISGLSKYDDGFIYSINIGSVGGMYKKTTEDDLYEGHITANDRLHIRDIDIKENKCVASVGDMRFRNLAVFELPLGRLIEITEGDTREDYPSFSKRSDNRILFSSSGVSNDVWAICGPYAAMVYDLDKGEMEELFSHEELDFIRVKEDKEGNVYCIKRPYNAGKDSDIIADILLFPWRMVKAVFGFFNAISILFGGESLRSNHDPRNPKGFNAKSKQKSDRELFIDGNVVNAEYTYKVNKQKGEKFPGLIPHSWELFKIDPNDNHTCLKKGVLDYALCENGDIIYSNGRAIVRISEGEETLIEKCKLANSIIEL